MRWKAWTRIGIAIVSKIILILTGLIRERELERDGGQTIRNSREVCLPENVLCLTRTLDVVVSLWSTTICENVCFVVLVFQKDHSLPVHTITYCLSSSDHNVPIGAKNKGQLLNL